MELTYKIVIEHIRIQNFSRSKENADYEISEMIKYK